ncbi:hypothetical protein L208DRAFT_1391203 [Tricholoma matsutake]|nr:hypothetical protein L208DRAFT_1391203 [Tricholoma matsutake 945]
MSIDKKSEGSENPLPTPVSASKPKSRITATSIIPIWVILSSSVIIYNNYLYNTLTFPYPVFTVTWHLFFAAIGTRILQSTMHLLDATNDVRMDSTTFICHILPIGFLFSGSLILSNTTYLYLRVSYIQMVKAFTPVSILLISWTSCIQDPTKKYATIVIMISTGVALTSCSELCFHLGGFIVQAGAILFKSSRLVLIQNLLHNLKMDPLVSLHYYAPICTLINLAILPFTDGLAPFYALRDIGPLILISNVAVAFLLNIAAIFLIGIGSSLVLTLTGVFKDILLITGSLQVFGYLIALANLDKLATVLHAPPDMPCHRR